ncbi:MAG TPA: plastocyanin/azurin family copper-binding protein [Ktedonobacteraceae bacterium]|nr:plastocyanin/azurin family copper-binding protein [Ktedonobacteraceae bacterium]
MSTQRSLRTTWFVLSASLLSLLFSALLPFTAGAAPASQPRTWHAVVAIENKSQSIQGMAFLPQSLWINVGDTVVWTAKAGDIHTVTFLKPGQQLPVFDPNDPLQILPQGGSTYDGVSYFSSGLIANFPGLPGGEGYKLTFGVTGDFTYHCLVHPSMVGVIHVRAAGTPYPHSQDFYDRQIEHKTDVLLHIGQKLTDQAADESSNLNVTLGIGNGKVSVVRFFPQDIVIHVGQTITFTNRDIMEPHTVTFGQSTLNDFAPYGNPAAFDGSAPLNSGFLGADPLWFGKTYKVTFTKAGSYAFRCDLHDYLGMLATIVVLP